MQRLEALEHMVGEFHTRDTQAPYRINSFMTRRDGDMQALDISAVVTGVGVYLGAVLRERAARRSTRAASRRDVGSTPND